MREENGNKILEVGDIIYCKGIRAEIDRISYQEYWDGYGFRTEFWDTKGNYRSWKQDLDGGFVLNYSPVPPEVIEHVKEYFSDHNSLRNYEVVEICRASEHPEDNYLYMVVAKKTCDYSYTVWTSWNEMTQCLNNGHYDLSTESVDVIKKEYFHKVK